MRKLLLLGALTAFAVTLQAEDIDGKVKDAVEGLAEGLVSVYDVSVGEFFIAGTETSSELSRSLHHFVTAHAPGTGRFRIVPRTRSLNRVRTNASRNAVIQGTFLPSGALIHVSIQLVGDPGGAVLDTQNFSLSVEELQKIPLAILPANIAEEEEIKDKEAILETPSAAPVQQITSPAAPEGDVFTIAAWPNSDTNTYLDGDKLAINLESNRDCFFKLYHIDSSDTMQLIHPSDQTNWDNRLTAYTTRTIGSDGRFTIEVPYGRDTIIAVASSAQFSNLEAEMGRRWKATRENAVAAMSYRGLSVQPVTSAAEITETRFFFTSLSQDYADESYSYRKPADMAEALQSLREDVFRQGGSFRGDEREGSFSAGALTGSYLVNRDEVIVKFRFTNSNQLTAPVTRSARGMGSAFNFSIDKPRNLTNAVRAVRLGIEGKGGAFTGDERQGNFRVSGITGQYRVSEQVSVSIVEKPLIIPNTLIEREARSYFAGQ